MYAKGGGKVAQTRPEARIFGWYWYEIRAKRRLKRSRRGFLTDIYPTSTAYSVLLFPRSMKLLLLSSLLALAAAPAVLAQVPATATIKTKVKPVGQPSVKTKMTQPTEAPADLAAPSDAVIDAKVNALTANMQKNLGLTPQQTEKVRVINRRGVEAVEFGRVHYRSNPRKLAGIVETAGRSRLEALKDVLNPSQFDKYQRKREEKMGVPNVQGVQGTLPPGLGGDQ